MKAPVFSFDVFDTALTRLVAKPVHVFNIMEEWLCIKNIKWKAFAGKRIAAEFEARRLNDFNKEVTFDEIYDQIKQEYSLTDDELQDVKNLELEVERNVLYPVPEIQKTIQNLIHQKKRYIFISDMYLPESFVRGILEKYGLWNENTALYLSSSIKKMKVNGELFYHVLEQEDITPRKLHHIGDNEESDLIVPAKMGIRSKLYSDISFSRYENAILEYDNTPELTRSRIVAILRYARLSCPYVDSHKKTIWNVSVNVSGPILISYVSWCLHRAKELKLTRLYFLARDGQVLLKIGSILNKLFNYDIDLRYLYASRQSLLLPSTTELNDEALEWIMAPTSTLTLRMIFNRVDIDVNAMSTILLEKGFQKKDYDRHLSPEERPKVKVLLLDQRVTDTILERARHHRSLASGYLQQEGLFDDERYAVVDIGWNGTLQRSISRLLAFQSSSFSVKGLYFGIRSRKTHKQEDIMEAFFSDYENPDPIEKTTYIVPMMELFVAADHGGVTHFENEGNRYHPVLMNEKNINGLKWGIQVQQQAYEFLTHLFVKEKINISLEKNTISRILNLFLTSPDKEEAKVYGSYLLAEEQNEAYYTPMAKKYNLVELLLHKANNFRHHHNEWEAGSLCLSNTFLKMILGMK